jgi:predicted ABC-type sugar transport system permease subunit
MQLMGLKAYPQYVAQGLVLICALALDVYQRNSVVRKAKLVTRTSDDPKE